jgi:hypothetical protein
VGAVQLVVVEITTNSVRETGVTATGRYNAVFEEATRSVRQTRVHCSSAEVVCWRR